jgi:uncharacterized membrane protein YjdF
MADGTWGRAIRLTSHVLQAALVGILAYALVTGDAKVAVNAGLVVPVAAFPLVVRRLYGRPLHPVLALWIAAAAFLHAVGAMGPYRTLGWYDQFAHGVSGALVAGVGYALVRTIETNYDTVDLPSKLRFVFIVVFAVSFGVAWEVAEFTVEQVAGGGGGDAMLVQYGLFDTVWDLVFDLFGGLVVAIWGTGYFDGLRSIIDRYVDGTERGAVDGPEQGPVDPSDVDAEQPQ